MTESETLYRLEATIRQAEQERVIVPCVHISILKGAFDAINSQRTEIETLKVHEEKEHQYCKNVCEPKYKAEIERLKPFRDTAYEVLSGYYAIIKAEAIKKYREKAAIKLAENARSDYWHWIDDTLYEVEKEMVGDTE